MICQTIAPTLTMSGFKESRYGESTQDAYGKRNMDTQRAWLVSATDRRSSPDHQYISVNWAMMERVINRHADIGFFSFQVNLAGTGQILWVQPALR